MSKKVIFLGAGASKDAGYPLCDEIFKVLKKEYRNCNIIPLKNYWDRFERFLSEYPELKTGNIEEIFTNIENLANTHNIMAESVLEKIGFMIESYFGYKNHIYKTLDLQYIRTMLKNADCVISVNWDNLAEFILAEEGNWYPSDGYGFKVSLVETSSNKMMRLPPSRVKVLKLHGSLGWRKKHDDTLYLRHYDMLKYVPRTNNTKDFRDKNDQSPSEDYITGEKVMIYPSYHKQFDHPKIKDIWMEAAKVLSEATEVDFVGYSLPPADEEVRKLLTPLIKRIVNGEVKVSCIVGTDTEGRTTASWRKFSGDTVKIINTNAKSYYE